jgi:hypothetical protein
VEKEGDAEQMTRLFREKPILCPFEHAGNEI